MAKLIPTGDYLEHVTTPGERWDNIAHDYYGDAHATEIIVRANADQFLMALEPLPVVFDRRMVIRVPVVEKIADDADLPFWKRS